MVPYPGTGPAVNATLAQALRIAGLGFRIFPLWPVVNGRCACEEAFEKPCDAKPGKHPHIGAWQQKACDLSEEGWIRSWWGENPDWGIGIATGSLSGLLVIDVDKLTPWVRALIEKFNGGPRVRTARGTHYYFRYPRDGFVYKNSASALAEGLDVRGEGGYVVAPGSMHAFGQKYVELVSIDSPLGDAPEELLALIRQKNGARIASGEAIAQSPVTQVGPIASGVPYGQHDAFLASVAGFLRGRWGLSEAAIRAALEHGPTAALQGSDPARPFTSTDFDRLTRSAASWKPENTIGGVAFVQDPIVTTAGPQVGEYAPPNWLVPGLLLEDSLAVLYGPPGAGKSSLFGYLIEHLAGRSIGTLHLGFEESPPRTIARLSPHALPFFHSVNEPERIKFPTLTRTLFTRAAALGVRLIMVDTLFDHFEERINKYHAPEVRPVLIEILRLCQEFKIGFLGGYHTNQGGLAQASTAFREVPRTILRMHKYPTGTVKLAIQKISDEAAPDASWEFTLQSRPLPNYPGRSIGVLAYQGQGTTTADDMHADHVDMLRGARGPDTLDKATARLRRITAILQADPLASAAAIFAEVGGKRADVLKQISSIRGQLTLSPSQSVPAVPSTVPPL